jgi:hypothetical protein
MHDRRELSGEKLGRWCESALGSPGVETLFECGNLSRVLGFGLGKYACVRRSFPGDDQAWATDFYPFRGRESGADLSHCRFDARK